MSDIQNPKVFISYSWSSEKMTILLAERLVSHGVDVVLDKWELKEGQDKYAFMEKSVNDPEINKVLIICDKSYTQKANNRQGGVGDETAIISPEIYGRTNQEKFIPIIIERDENGKEFVPAYIKSRIYIDLSEPDNFEDEYEKLIRNLYNQPLYQKPQLGHKPEWLNEEKTNLFPLKDLISQIKGAKNVNKQSALIRRFRDTHIEVLKTYYNKEIKTGKQVFDIWGKLKLVRDCFLDWLDALLEIEFDIGELLCDTFEELYNTLMCAKSYDENAHYYGDIEFEPFKLYIWELFICTVVFWRHYEKYDVLHRILSNTYFLVEPGLSSKKIPGVYFSFRHYSSYIDDEYKRKIDSNKCTVAGDTLCRERERKPIYTKKSIALADLFLYQIGNGFRFSDELSYEDYWFPMCYVYAEYESNGWEKLVSKRYCKKICTLFGTDSINVLKELISLCTLNKEIGYCMASSVAPSILSNIKLENIGALE